jgi:hypothetical protein
MNGLGYEIDLINNNMKYTILIVLGLAVAFSIYWIMDWHDKHPDGE